MFSYLFLLPSISQKMLKFFFDLIKVFFTIKIITNLLEICIEDPVSKIRDREKPIPDPDSGAKKALQDP